MEAFLTTVSEFFRIYISAPFQTMQITDVLDIIALTAVLYLVYSFVRVRRAGRVASGLVLLFIMYGVFGLIGLRATYALMRIVFSSGIVVLAIIFQSELRAGLEKLGNSVTELHPGLGLGHVSAGVRMVNEVIDAACAIAQQEHDGAIIVFQGTSGFADYAENGVKLDATVSSELLTGIFVNKAPLHDGAVMIANGRIASAGCKLPLEFTGESAKGLGTRHRAAIGITKECDSVAVVVSEERHIISVASNGTLKRDYNPGGMKDLQTEEGLKTVKNRLREDLFRLVLGQTLDNANKKMDKEKKQLEKEALVKKAQEMRKKVRKEKNAPHPTYRLARLVRVSGADERKDTFADAHPDGQVTLPTGGIRESAEAVPDTQRPATDEAAPVGESSVVQDNIRTV